MIIANSINNFKEIVQNPNFDESDFGKVERIFQQLLENSSRDEIPSITEKIHHILGKENIENSVQGFAFRKPYGYAGDFEIIDKMYRKVVHPDPKIGIWDKFYHYNAAAVAVRNRKKFFKELLLQYSSSKPIEVLNLASGPCRDIFEFFEETKSKNIHFDCIDMDTNAIDFARSLNKKHLSNISFIHKNIFRFKPEKKYDLIWSAGLFDYFVDKIFIFLLTKIKEWIKDSGKVIIGNFSNVNPTQGYMVIMANWILNLRSKDHLRKLAVKSGYQDTKISIEEEAAKINLFLVMKK